MLLMKQLNPEWGRATPLLLRSEPLSSEESQIRQISAHLVIFFLKVQCERSPEEHLEWA